MTFRAFFNVASRWAAFAVLGVVVLRGWWWATTRVCHWVGKCKTGDACDLSLTASSDHAAMCIVSALVCGLGVAAMVFLSKRFIRAVEDEQYRLKGKL